MNYELCPRQIYEYTKHIYSTSTQDFARVVERSECLECEHLDSHVGNLQGSWQEARLAKNSQAFPRKGEGAFGAFWEVPVNKKHVERKRGEMERGERGRVELAEDTLKRASQ